MSYLRISHVTKSFGANAVLKDVDLDIQDGEFIALVGPSGCGKSTLMRIVAGLEAATSGEIHMDGRIVNDVAPRDRDVAMVFQNYALYPNLTVAENVMVGREGGGSGHFRRHQMGAAPVALAALEIAVGGGGAALAGLQLVGIHAKAHGAAGLAPFEAGGREDLV